MATRARSSRPLMFTIWARGGARAAVVLASDASFSVIVAEGTVLVPEVAPYLPGRFFLRELPPVRAVLAGVRGARPAGRGATSKSP